MLGGWPDERKDVHPLITYYFCHRDEIFMHDGLILRGDRVIVPHELRSQMKNRIHSSHMGVGSCLSRAKECLFWPNMNADLTEYIAACSTCRNYETASPKETLRDRSDDAAWTTLPCHHRLLLWILGTGQTSRHLVKGCDPQTQSAFCTIRMPRTGGQ